MNTKKNKLKIENEYSKALVKISSNKLAEIISNIPDELFEKDSKELEEEVKPSETSRQLKIVVQEEIEAAQLEGRNIIASNLFNGVMHHSYFYRNILPDKKLMAWLLIPDVKDVVKIKRTYKKGLDDIRSIMDDILIEMEETNDPEVKMSLRNQYHTYFKTFASRAAPIVQRQEIKQMTLKSEVKNKDVESIEERIKKLESELGKNK